MVHDFKVVPPGTGIVHQPAQAPVVPAVDDPGVAVADGLRLQHGRVRPGVLLDQRGNARPDLVGLFCLDAGAGGGDQLARLRAAARGAAALP